MQEQQYWHKQAKDQPLFADLLWSRPEHQSQAGKLLIVGGNGFGFAAPAEAYAAANKAGIGITHVLLPDALRRTVGKALLAGDFAPSTPSGSFSQKALSELLSHSQWADGVLLAGDLGRNSETAVLLEKFIEHYHGQLTVTKDAADYFTGSPGNIIMRADMTLVLSFAQLQKLAMQAKFSQVFTFDAGIIKLVDLLHAFTEKYAAHIIVKHLGNIFVAVDGQVCSTKLIEDVDMWRTTTAAYVSVWWLQNPSIAFKALSTAVYNMHLQP